ncbi:MAG: helix-turn-helix transcriptional regulator [Candidatus Moranbacteria bacterium]|jgi:transcriptional regulator with XRE-family HTH domain|nr:helix-turn-helix transcriptional regulator [Candidatus Moranbacteria bacterium]
MYSLEPTPYEVGLKIAQRHRSIRKKLKISQKEMAERSGVSLGSLKRFEASGKISLESLLKLIHLLGRLSDFDLVLKEKENLDDIEKLFTK